MKYYNCKIMIPWFDTDGMKNWTTITITDTIDRRRIYRGVRRFVYDNFKLKVSNDWVKTHCPIIGISDKDLKFIKSKKPVDTYEQTRLDMLCIEVMKECEEDLATKDNTATSVQGSTIEGTGEPLSTVST